MEVKFQMTPDQYRMYEMATPLVLELLEPNNDLSPYFRNGRLIRHKDGTGWIGAYDAVRRVILCRGKSYSTLSGFARAYYRTIKHSAKRPNGWEECEYQQDDGVWRCVSFLKFSEST